ncbi:MAG TPA: 30S ribosomal protein S8 [Thermodesulforhabdus norvegica]|uniref:Small ribosomal subunit protein uS8 n=1 Tax=Thermodesulforhabdus norvegica TaxID=39841 RepID=A0A7C1B1A5_9BACT|nr:30S ribosomal protein S8 [Deltaproteobacteria bacterium]MBW2068352.1 30S ribosomal protein S8 [Deltaproteobacteria bacterium]HDL90480.1 30S ribosomal protein S8 [Thermodesulforhabdus norvegica]
MVMTDPIADFLVRIANAQMARHDKVDIPASKMKLSITRILKEEGYIKHYKYIKDNKQGIIRIHLKYDENRRAAIMGLKRISKPGRRVYVGCDEIPRVLNGLGIAILSTSQGILTDKEARKRRVGGELLCAIW